MKYARAVDGLHAVVRHATERREVMDNNENIFGEVISVYTQEQAIEDGVLIHTGNCGRHKVIFTSNLFYDGFGDLRKRTALVKKGLEMLKKDDPEDTSYMRLRVIEKNEIWVIWNAEGITFMKPEDY